MSLLFLMTTRVRYTCETLRLHIDTSESCLASCDLAKLKYSRHWGAILSYHFKLPFYSILPHFPITESFSPGLEREFCKVRSRRAATV